MAFDGFVPEQQRIQPPPQEFALADVQERAKKAEAQLNDAEKNLNDFFALALSGERLTPDQKNLLIQLQSDYQLSRLQEVVHADESGQYTFRDYFGDAEDVLQAIQARIVARDQASDAYFEAVKAVKFAQKPSLENAQVMPKLARVETPVPGSARAQESFNARFQGEWNEYNKRTEAHLEAIRNNYFSDPIEMPQPGKKRAASETQAASIGDTNDPFAAKPETISDPYAIAGPNDQTVVMNAVPSLSSKKPSRFAQLFS